MVHRRKSESDDSKNHTRTSNLMHFIIFFVVWSINRNVHINVAMAKLAVLNETNSMT